MKTPNIHYLEPKYITERILFLQMLMLDIRLGWHSGKTARKDKRAIKALSVLRELCYLNNTRKIWKSFDKHEHKFYQTIGLYLTGNYEGRILRGDYSEGGYENLEIIHKLLHTPENYNTKRTQWFKRNVKKYIQYHSSIFDYFSRNEFN